MENQTILEALNEKVLQMLQQFNHMKAENEVMRNELITLKGESEIKNQELEKLTEMNILKDIEIEDIVSKIESILG
ncbi:hypothetical protein [Sulfurimonas sp.]|jgi:hypothetical protein|uniref:hypothetical protein n=1 Tax=Sulfurimonas sp. TaxID=2022749 RepID=UPI0025DF42A9|nr:hypothetical protein [Sulfurimonas sp.]MBT5934994.1 hypothetical protein [Sulfurimonas sp.]